MNYNEFKEKIENNIKNPKVINELLKPVTIEIIGADILNYKLTFEDKKIKIDTELQFETEIEEAIIYVTLEDFLESIGTTTSVTGIEDNKYTYRMFFYIP